MNSPYTDRMTGSTINPGDIATRSIGQTEARHYLTYNPITSGQPVVEITVTEDSKADCEVTVTIERTVPVIHAILQVIRHLPAIGRVGCGKRTLR